LVNQQAANYNTPPTRERSYGFPDPKNLLPMSSVDKNASDEKQKGLGNKPSPNYYQATVLNYCISTWLLAVTIM